jgi:uncharacterized membrane protein YphA (DoxX/SURF4 family)
VRSDVSGVVEKLPKGLIRKTSFLGLVFPALVSVVLPSQKILGSIFHFLNLLLVMAGFKTRWATLPLLFTMLMAAFYAHGSDPFSEKELSLLFFTSFLSILISGGGRFSVDGCKGKSK